MYYNPINTIPYIIIIYYLKPILFCILIYYYYDRNILTVGLIQMDIIAIIVTIIVIIYDDYCCWHRGLNALPKAPRLRQEEHKCFIPHAAECRLQA